MFLTHKLLSSFVDVPACLDLDDVSKFPPGPGKITEVVNWKNSTSCYHSTFPDPQPNYYIFAELSVDQASSISAYNN